MVFECLPLGKATATASASLPGPTTVRDVLGFTLGKTTATARSPPRRPTACMWYISLYLSCDAMRIVFYVCLSRKARKLPLLCFDFQLPTDLLRVTNSTRVRHGASFIKLVCISRSSSHRSKWEVMCLVTCLELQGTGKKIAWLQTFPRSKPEWTELMWHLSCSLSLWRELLLHPQNSSVSLKCLCFGCTPMCKGLWNGIGIFSRLNEKRCVPYTV